MSPEREKIEAPERYSQILCIGAGVAGIAAGAHLKRKYNFTDIHFYDKNDRLGGTWATNTYPGCACDVPTALYSFSFAPKSDWTVLFPAADEIRAYIESVARDYDLPRKMTFRHEVRKCEWINSRDRWRVYVEDLTTRKIFVHECKILLTAVGGLDKPKELNVPGKENFKGAIFHSARWDHSATVEDKNVIVVGNGCTGTQLVPALVPRVKHLTQIIRSNHWLIDPGPSVRDIQLKGYPPWMLWIFRYIPGMLLLHRFMIFLGFCEARRMFYNTPDAAKRRAAAEEAQLKHLRETVPAEYVDILTPKFSIGCKRRVMDMGYYETLHSPKVSLKMEEILEVLPHGIRTNKGTYPADVIVCATGFQTADYIAPIQVYGENGEELQDYWARTGGVGAYQCTAVSNFPNMFMFFGPNSATGHTSIIMYEERTVEYVAKVIDPVLRGVASRVSVKEEAERGFVDAVRRDLKNSVWNSGCKSWYITADGYNPNMYPWSDWWHIYQLAWPRWSDWNITYTPRSKLKGRVHIRGALGMIAMGVFIMTYYGMFRTAQLKQLAQSANSTLLEAVGRLQEAV